jgi:hypothetical protein
MYGIPPFFNCILTIVNLALYRTRSVSLVYAVSITSVTAAGWIVVLGIWGDCLGNTPEYMGAQCYEDYLETNGDGPVGISTAFNGVMLTLVCLILITQVSCQ